MSSKQHGKSIWNINRDEQGNRGLIKSDFGLEVIRGNIKGWTHVNKFGRNPDVDISASEEIWDAGGTYPFLASAVTLSIQSDDVNDTSAGTGMRTVEIQGLDSSWVLQTETIILNGTTGVNSASTYRRIFRMKGLTAGSGGVNAGAITGTNGGTTYAEISAEKGQTLMAIYTIPAATTGYLVSVWGGLIPSGSAAGTKEGEVDLIFKDGDTSTPCDNIKFSLGVATSGNSYFEKVFRQPITVPAKTDVRCVYHASDNNSQPFAGFDILMEAD